MAEPNIKVQQEEDVVDQIHEFNEKNGYILEEEGGADLTSHKTASDGHTILIPQPSDDPNDPLNWSAFKKHVILVIISAIALLPDYGSATGAVTLLAQAVDWNMTPNEVLKSQSGNVFLVGAGGLFVVAFSAYFGRLPILFWFTLLAFVLGAWCAGATSFTSYEVARILSGFFSTVMQGGGLMFINDMFFFHERARKINIWTGFIILSPYLGPLVAAFVMTTQTWPWPFWIYTILCGLCLVATVIWVDETYYDRRLSPEHQPLRKSRALRLIGVEQFHSRSLRNTFAQAVMRPLQVILKPTVFISVIYYLLTFTWVVGINLSISLFMGPLYGFQYKQIGFFYFTPIVGAILGEAVGHWLHDFIANRYIRTHNGHFEPEARLIIIWLSTPFMVAGLVILGFALGNVYHYMIVSLGWGLYIFGIMITTVSVNAYNLDSYPEGSGEVAAWINFSRTTGGFIISYFQIQWAQAMGPKASFGIQAAICAAASLFIIFLQIKGKALRLGTSKLRFQTM